MATGIDAGASGGSRMRAAFGVPLRDDVRSGSRAALSFDVIPDGRAALGATEPEPTQRRAPTAPSSFGGSR